MDWTVENETMLGQTVSRSALISRYDMRVVQQGRWATPTDKDGRTFESAGIRKSNRLGRFFGSSGVSQQRVFADKTGKLSRAIDRPSASLRQCTIAAVSRWSTRSRSLAREVASMPYCPDLPDNRPRGHYEYCKQQARSRGSPNPRNAPAASGDAALVTSAAAQVRKAHNAMLNATLIAMREWRRE